METPPERVSRAGGDNHWLWLEGHPVETPPERVSRAEGTTIGSRDTLWRHHLRRSAEQEGQPLVVARGTPYGDTTREGQQSRGDNHRLEGHSVETPTERVSRTGGTTIGCDSREHLQRKY